MLPQRASDSHKGQNGRVMIIGGSLDFFGAPILAALGALGAGADLVYLLVPECNFEVSRSFYPDFIVRKYPGNFVNSRAFDAAKELLPKIDCLLVGPGISENPESLRVITNIIKHAGCHAVLDAEAIPAIAQLGLQTEPTATNAHRYTITPHRGEMNEITEGAYPDDPEEEVKLVENFAKKWGITLLLKGPRDIIASPFQKTRFNTTGNAGMTVGGTGDILAGVTASFIAQHKDPYEACCAASFVVGAVGDNLYKIKGYNFIATDVALELPYTIKSIQ